MRVLVIYAHPLADSFSAALHRAAVDTLRMAGHAVDDCDLYAEGFSPVLTAAERSAYHEIGANLDGVARHVERLRAAEALVICAPTWWYGMPAMLKGYFDRVWLPGVAFDLLPQGGAIRPLLTNIRKLTVVTTTGSPWWFMQFAMGNPGKLVLTRGLRRLLAKDARLTYLVQHGIDNSSLVSRARFLARVSAHFARF